MVLKKTKMIKKPSLYKATKLVLGITIPKRVKKSKLLDILINAIINKATPKTKPKLKIKKVKKIQKTIIGEGSGKVIDVDTYLNKIRKMPKAEIKISKKRPKLTKFKKTPN